MTTNGEPKGDLYVKGDDAAWQAYLDKVHHGNGHSTSDLLRALKKVDPEKPSFGPVCDECDDGLVGCNTCDECGDRHCGKCEPCTEGVA